MDQGDGADAGADVAEGVEGELVLKGGGLHIEEADDELQIVLDAVMYLPHKPFLLLQQTLLAAVEFDKAVVAFVELLLAGLEQGVAALFNAVAVEDEDKQ